MKNITGGIAAAGAATSGGPLAGKFRSDLAVVGGTAWQAERNQTDDRKANGGKTNAEYTASEADYEPSCASRSF
jgi:hypothetical protein